MKFIWCYMNEKKYIGSMFIELDDNSVIEVGMAETQNGIVPVGFRDARTFEKPERFPSAKQVRDAIELAKWCYLNEVVFSEGRVSDVPMSMWRG